ncbi:hypothetical protein [Bradyrhizobium sp. RDI18]|uniref:hypothetical protein n=1 Tax=Bradyrhizobium sp. RDI18 TaxID=3367400 RepID=UPI0037243A36
MLQASAAAAINDNDLNLLELLSRETEIDGSRSPPGKGTSQHTSLQASPAAAAISGNYFELLALLEREMEVVGSGGRRSAVQLIPGVARTTARCAGDAIGIKLPLSPLPDSDGSLNFDTALLYEMRNDAHDSRASCELVQPQQSSYPAAAIPAWAPTDDFGHIVPLGWNHGFQPAPDVLIGALNRTGVLPGPFQATNLFIRGQPYMAQLGAGIREATPNNPLGANINLIPGIKDG